jgi:hypothetical protein
MLLATIINTICVNIAIYCFAYATGHINKSHSISSYVANRTEYYTDRDIPTGLTSGVPKEYIPLCENMYKLGAVEIARDIHDQLKPPFYRPFYREKEPDREDQEAEVW